MLRILSLLWILAALPVAAQQQENRQVLAAELYQRMQDLAPSNATQNIIRDSLGAFESQPCFAQMQPEIERMIEKYSLTDQSKNMSIKAYANAFSEAELKELVAFSHTPVGAKWFAKQPQIAAEAARTAMMHFQQHQMQIAQETMQILEDYQQPDCEKKAVDAP